MYIYRVHQAGYGIRIRVAAPQEYVNIYSTRRLRILLSPSQGFGHQVGVRPPAVSWRSPHPPSGILLLYPRA